MIRGHGDDGYRYGLPVRANFSSNAWYGADLQGLYAHLAAAMPSLVNYPEPDSAQLGAEMSAAMSIPAECLCMTAGATEAFYLIALAFRSRRSAIAVPSFREYEDACTLHDHQIDFFPAASSAWEASLRDGNSPIAHADLVWLCNPNNPDGQIIPRAMLTALIDRHPQRLFIIDQSYAAFTDKPVLQVAEAIERPNVILVGSLTKQYGIAGLRLGWFAASTPLVQKVARGKIPWSVNRLADEAGHYLLAHRDEFSLDCKALLAETSRLASAVEATGVARVLPSNCHFFAALLNYGDAPALKQYLVERHGLLIRDASNFRGYDTRHIRIATQRPEENEWLINALREWKCQY